MMKIFRREFLLLWFGVLLFFVALVCSATPILWNLAGRPAESYPEYGAIIFGLPLAILIIVLGIFVGKIRIEGDHPLRREFWLMWSGVLVYLLGLIVPWLLPMERDASIMGFFVGIPLGVALIVLGSVIGSEALKLNASK